MKHHHLMPPMAKMLQAGQDRRHAVEQVAEHQHDPPLLEPLGQIVKNRAGRRFPLGRACSITCSSCFKCDGLPLARTSGPNLLDRTSPGRRCLADAKSNTPAPLPCIAHIPISTVAALRPAIRHALASVEQQIADQIGFLLVLLEIILVGLAVDFPIDDSARRRRERIRDARRIRPRSRGTGCDARPTHSLRRSAGLAAPGRGA